MLFVWSILRSVYPVSNECIYLKVHGEDVIPKFHVSDQYGRILGHVTDVQYKLGVHRGNEIGHTIITMIGVPWDVKTVVKGRQ